jgi:hypothetical protein
MCGEVGASFSFAFFPSLLDTSSVHDQTIVEKTKRVVDITLFFSFFTLRARTNPCGVDARMDDPAGEASHSHEISHSHEVSCLSESSHLSEASDLSETEESHADEVCDWCSSFDWEKLTSSDESLRFNRRDVETLESSRCRICRLLAKVIKRSYSHFGSYTLHHNGYGRAWRLSPSRSGHDVSEITLSLLSVNNSLSPALCITRIPIEDEWKHPHYISTQQVHDDQIRSWIEECRSAHSDYCALDSGSRSRLKNLRVIDCKQRAVLSAPLDCDYVVLSYVWGQGVDNQQGNLASLEHPPATISHAISFTLRMGYRYLWIDRYVRKLDIVFEGSTLTILVYKSK